jgi:hypothetical protein
MTLELREAEKKLELSTALEALGKILVCPILLFPFNITYPSFRDLLIRRTPRVTSAKASTSKSTSSSATPMIT